MTFSGVPNESQTGEITFAVTANFKCRRFVASIVGTTFSNGKMSLETRYQPDVARKWYKAGEPFIIQGSIGTEYRLKFEAISGAAASSQQAGTYTAKLAINILSMK